MSNDKEETPMNIRRTLVVTGVVWLAAVTGRFALADHHEGAAKPATVALEGEIIDLQCALLHPDAAPKSEHATCAKTCIGKGLPAGLKVGDQVYLLLGTGHGSVKDLAKHAGARVIVTGVAAERFGIKALRVDAVKRVGAPDAAKPSDAPVVKDAWMCPMGCVKSDKPGKCTACGMDMDKVKKKG